MNQSSVIGGAMVLAYVIFIIYRGELPCYMQILGIATAAGCPPNLVPAGCTGASTTPATTGSGSGTAVQVNPIFNLGRNGPGGGIGIGSIGIGLGGVGIGIGLGGGPGIG